MDCQRDAAWDDRNRLSERKALPAKIHRSSALLLQYKERVTDVMYQDHKKPVRNPKIATILFKNVNLPDQNNRNSPQHNYL